MRKTKISCAKCSSMDKGIWGSMAFCEEARKHIKDINVLPKWCPKAKLHAIEEMSIWLPSKTTIKRAIDKMFEPNPDFHRFIEGLKRKEVRKKMAIDYKEEWDKLRKSTGWCTIIKNGATTLERVMGTQIRGTINAREKLMQEYMRENMLTDICGADKHYHHVKITNARIAGGPIGTMYIHKADFQRWIYKRERR